MVANGESVKLPEPTPEFRGVRASASSPQGPRAATEAAAAAADLAHIAAPLRPLAVPCADLLPDPANARRHPEANLEAIKGSLRVYGQRKPVVVNRRFRPGKPGQPRPGSAPATKSRAR
jgi:hypothetical protein